MARVYFRAFVLVILVMSTFFPLMVRAADYNAGVRAGDWIKYGQFKITWSGNGTEPQWVTDWKKVDWTRIDFENISGTTVTLNQTTHYDNGTQISQIGSVDVRSGSISSSDIIGFAPIAYNLKTGDPIRNQIDSSTINQTTTGIYACAIRNVNLFETTYVLNNQTYSARAYWDQGTGALVDLYEKKPDFSEYPYNAIIEDSCKAIETNMWNADLVGTVYNNLLYIVGGIIIIIIMVAVAIVLIRKKPSVPPQTPPAQTTKTPAPN